MQRDRKVSWLENFEPARKPCQLCKGRRDHVRMQQLAHGVSDIVWDRSSPVRPRKQRNLPREICGWKGLRSKLAVKSFCAAIAERGCDRPADAAGYHRHQCEVTADLKL